MGGCSDTTKRKERSSTLLSQSSFSVGVVPKKSKPSSPTRSSSNMKNTNIDDLLDVILVDILCRLPSFHFLFKCKSVCKRWSVLLSDPYLIRRFLFRLQSQNTPIPEITLINRKGERSFPIAFNPPPLKILTKIFVRLMFSRSLKREPVVVGACNDLVLCCATKYFQRDYFICNPYTNQWVALPPVSRILRDAPVGFICEPYYNYPKKDEQEVHQPRSTIIHDQLININVDYRCMVVRILPYDNICEYEFSYKYKVEIFSFAIGEWRESIITFPRKFRFDFIDTNVHFAHGEMLYWSIWGGCNYNKFLIGLNPFMISHATDGNIINISNSGNNSNSGDSHQCRYIELLVEGAPEIDKHCNFNQIQGGVVPRAGVGGCLQICLLDSNNSAYIWELKNEEDNLIIEADGSGKLYSKHLHLGQSMKLICLDPNTEGNLYVALGGSQFKLINLHTGLSTYEMNMPESARMINKYCFPLTEQPWWPTPVPTLPAHRSP